MDAPTIGVTHLSGTEVIQLIVKRGDRSTPCGCPLLGLLSRGIVPKTRGSGIASDRDLPGYRTGSLISVSSLLPRGYDRLRE